MVYLKHIFLPQAILLASLITGAGELEAQKLDSAISFFIYEDTTSILAFKEISALDFSSNFRPLKTNIVWQKAAKFPIWIRFKPFNRDHVPRYLDLSDTRFPQLEYHLPYDTEYKRYCTGYAHKFDTRPIQADHYVFPISNEQSWHYLRIQPSTFLNTKLQVHTSAMVLQGAARRNLLYTLYIALVLIITVGVLFYIYSIRCYNYLFYIGYILSVSTVNLMERGYCFEEFWPNTPILNFYFPIPIFFITIFLLFFLRGVWTLEKKSVRYLYRLMWITTVLLFPYVIYLLNEKRYAEANAIAMQFSSIVSFLAIVNGLISYFYFEGVYRLSMQLINVGLCIYCASGIVFVLTMDGMLPINFFTDNAMIYGSMLEVCFLTIAVILRSGEIYKVQRIKISRQESRR
jgi:hypothetical protein